MCRFLVMGLFLSFGVCSGAFGLTGSGDSPVGSLETVAPVFSGLTVTPSEAAAGDLVTIAFTVSESLDTDPTVMVNGNPTTMVGGVKSTNFSYEYTVAPSDPPGAATLTINGADPVGNFGTLNDNSALEILEAAAALPVQTWPVALALLLVATAVLVLRRRPAALLGLALLLAAPAVMAQSPTVSNVAFIQQPTGSGTEVIITYDLVTPNGPSDMTVAFSKNGGNDGFPFPVTSVTGDVTGVTTGTGYTIVWDITADYPNEDFPSVQVRVTADDGFIMPPPYMIPVAAGSFDMGNSGVGDDATFNNSNELPVHTVTLSAYEIGRFQVTNQQVTDVFNWADDQGFFTTVNANTATAFGQELLDLDSSNIPIEYVGGAFQPETRTGDPGGATVYSMAEHPVVMISWYGAVAFCNWLSLMEGRTPVYDTNTWTANFANDGYHLPTEAQWERAAAWDGSKHWIFGDTSDTLTGDDQLNFGAGSSGPVNPLGLTAFPYTSPVGWFDGTNVSPNGSVQTLDSASPIGAYDMSGNVSEWCHDRYDSGYYAVSPANDPEGPATGVNHTMRGGGWSGSLAHSRTAHRTFTNPGNFIFYVGFRLALTPEYDNRHPHLTVGGLSDPPTS